MNCPIDEYKIMAYLDGDFSEQENREFIEHISACAECAALLKAYEQQERLLEQYFATRFKEAVKSPKPLIVKASNRPLVLRASLPLYAAAAIVFFLMLAGSVLFVNYLLHTARQGREIGRVHALSGQAQYFEGNKLLPLEIGMKIRSGTRFKTTKNAYLAIEMLPLAKEKETEQSNIVEFKDNSVASFQDYQDRNELVLERGEIWVHLNKKPQKKIAVRTAKAVITDRGTIFNVAQGMSGTYVGVVSGAVIVDIQGSSNTVEPGNVYFTYEDKTGDNVRRHIFWSHYREKLLALLGPESETQKRAVAAVPQLRVRELPPPQSTFVPPADDSLGSLATTQIMPDNTRFFVEFASMPETIAEWRASDYSRILQDPELIKWWNSKDMEQFRRHLVEDIGLLQWLEAIQGISGSVSMGIAPEGIVLVADCREDVAKMRALFEGNITPLLNKWKKSYFREDFSIELRRGYLLGVLSYFHGSNKLLKKTREAVDGDKPTGFTEGHFYNQLRANVPNSRLTLALDVRSIMQQKRRRGSPSFNQFLDRVGLDNMDYLMMSPDFAGRGINQALRIAFEGQRHGVLGWLDEPGSMGAFRYYGADSHFIAAARIKSPDVIFNEALRWVFEDLHDETLSANDDAMLAMWLELASCLGNEAAIGFQNPILPIPNIQATIEIIDPIKFHELMIEAVDRLNKLNPYREIEIRGKEYRNKLIVSVAGPGWTFEPAYVILDDYLVIGPGEPFVRHAVDVFLEGHSIAAESGFQNLLPSSGQSNFSMLFFQNFSSLAPQVMNKMKAALNPFNAKHMPNFNLLNRFQAAGISYAFANDEYVDFYINGSSGVDFNIGGALPLIASLWTPRVMHGDYVWETAQESLKTTAIGIESFNVDNNRYPNTLDELLAPVHYLSSIPVDVYSKNGETVKYYVNQSDGAYVLYSVGPDQTDNMGEIYYDPTNGASSVGDIIFLNRY